MQTFKHNLFTNALKGENRRRPIAVYSTNECNFVEKLSRRSAHAQPPKNVTRWRKYNGDYDDDNAADDGIPSLYSQYKLLNIKLWNNRKRDNKQKYQNTGNASFIQSNSSIK